MREYEFTLVIEGDIDDDTVLDRLYVAGCDDATFGSVDGVGYGRFTREGSSLLEAMLGALADVERAGLRVLHVEPDDLATMADLAKRLGKSREYIRKLIMGAKGPGNFPAPVSHVAERSRLWRWSDVAAWAGFIEADAAQSARVIAAVNAVLELRRADLDKKEKAQLMRAVPG